MVCLVAMEMLLPWQQGNFTTTQINESILSSYLAHSFLQQYVLIFYLVAIETPLPWQPENCDINQLCESILSSYLTRVFFGMKHINSLTWLLWK